LLFIAIRKESPVDDEECTFRTRELMFSGVFRVTAAEFLGRMIHFGYGMALVY